MASLLVQSTRRSIMLSSFVSDYDENNISLEEILWHFGKFKNFVLKMAKQLSYFPYG